MPEVKRRFPAGSCNNAVILAQPRTPESAGGNARSFAVEQARGQLRHLTSQISRTTKSCNPGAVHDLRVAIRRFTQAIAVTDMLKNRRRLKKIMAFAGEVRNYDVALKFNNRFKGPHAVHLQSKLEDRRRESEGLLVAELIKWRDRRLSLKWRAALGLAPSSDQDVDQLARRVIGRVVKDYQKRGNEASSPKATPTCIHHFRIAAKKFRYALELFQPLYGTSLDPLVAGLKCASTLLGDINDCVTVAAIVAEYKGGNRLADRLKKRQHKKTEEFRKYWKEEFSRSSIDPLSKKPAASITFEHPRRESAA
jgi:CHAD domain-containing protein